MIEVKKYSGTYELIPSNAVVTLTDIENHHEILYMTNSNNKIKIKKIDKERYILVETGEIKYFKNTNSRKENINELRVTFKKLRELINNNFKGHINEKGFTITYKFVNGMPVRDTKKLYFDFGNFIKRTHKKFGEFEYISVVEPQGTGNWHCHILLKFRNNPGFIPGEIIEKLWGHGFVKVKRIKSNDNMGAYLTAYLADIEYNKENIKVLIEKGLDKSMPLKEIEIEGKTKRFIKGGRLYLYPTGINIFRKSKGIMYPEKIKGHYKELKKKHNLSDANYRREAEIWENEILINTVVHEQYNKSSLKIE